MKIKYEFDENYIVERNLATGHCGVCHEKFGYRPLCPDCREEIKKKKREMEALYSAETVTEQSKL